MKNNFKILMIGFCLILLAGCEYKGRDSIMEQIATDKGNIDEIQDNVEKDTSTGLNTVTEEQMEPVTGDDLIVAAEFALDLSKENFTKLTKAYSYDEAMFNAMNSDETKKTIMFYNADSGELKKINDPYVLSLGAYQYVYVPVECSNKNFNYQIVFDGNHNIVGFSYGEYALKEQAPDTIPDGVYEEEYTFTSDGYVIPGTFTAPKDSDHLPVVILVQGSGPSNRDEGVYENKPFRDIAWALAKEGIASYRFDKRSYLYGQQMKDDITVTIDDEITNDVLAAVAMVKNIEQIDSTSIYILGHSLGGYIIPRIARKLPDASGFILLAAPAQHLKDFIYDQYQYLAEEDEVITKEEEQQLNIIAKEIRDLINPKNIPENQRILGAYRNYWLDLSTYDPIRVAGEITKPVLVLQGERDYQVTMDQFKIWEENFKESQNWHFKSYASLNHFMMPGMGKSYPEEYKQKSYVDNELIKDIAEFIKNVN